MNTIRARFFSIGIFIFCAGCGSFDHTLQQQIASEAQELQPSVEDDSAVMQIAEQVASEGIEGTEREPLSPEARLDTYIEIALRDNPSIRRAIRQLQALGYQVPQVTSLDDPMINIIPPTGDMTETAAGMMKGVAGIAQKIPFPGKLSAPVAG